MLMLPALSGQLIPGNDLSLCKGSLAGEGWRSALYESAFCSAFDRTKCLDPSHTLATDQLKFGGLPEHLQQYAAIKVACKG